MRYFTYVGITLNPHAVSQTFQTQYSSDARPSIVLFCAIQTSKLLVTPGNIWVSRGSISMNVRCSKGIHTSPSGGIDPWRIIDEISKALAGLTMRKAGNPTLAFEVILVSAQASYQTTILWPYPGHFALYFITSTICEYRNQCGDS